MRYAFTIEGRPVPQGSMVASYNRKLGVSHVHHVQGEALAMWRASIRIAARDGGLKPSALPIRLTVQFGMPRPKAHMTLRRGGYIVKQQHYYDRPAHMPDIDKLIRAVMDALTKVAYNDDGQIVEVMASKVYGDSTYIEVTDEGLSPEYTAFGTVSPEVAIHTQEDTSKG